MSNVSNSLTLRLIRTGKTLSVTLSPNALLVQFVNKIGTEVVVAPNWGIAANQPTIKPMVATSGGGTAVLSDHQWLYNGEIISEDNEKFSINKNSGAITIIQNLASESNLYTDTLTYKGMCNMSGAMVSIEKSIDIEIRQAGVNECSGEIFANSNTLSSEITKVALQTTLFQSTSQIDNYSVEWLKGVNSTGKEGKTLEVTRDDINGSQLYIAIFKVAGKEVDRASYVIVDNSDEWKVLLESNKGNSVMESDSTAVVTASLLRNGASYTAPNAAWKLEKLHGDDLSLIDESLSNEITVVLEDYVNNNKDVDVIVNAQVEF